MSHVTVNISYWRSTNETKLYTRNRISYVSCDDKCDCTLVSLLKMWEKDQAMCTKEDKSVVLANCAQNKELYYLLIILLNNY